MLPSDYDPDGWPAPQRAPQHAATPFGRSKDFRQRAHVALRLGVTAGTWAAGLCLVIGLIVLVASAAGSGRIEPVTTASSAQHVARHTSAGAHVHKARTRARVERPRPQPAPPRADASSPAAAVTVVAVFSGRGDQTTPSFVIDSAARWQIQWAYVCQASVPAGLLVVEAGAPTAIGADISQSGPAGHGDTWLAPGGHTHSLVVISSCSWTMTVLQEP